MELEKKREGGLFPPGTKLEIPPMKEEQEEELRTRLELVGWEKIVKPFNVGEWIDAN